MSEYGVLLISGHRTHQEGYAAAFSADPRARLVAVADEADVPEHRHALNRSLADEYGVPYVPDLGRALSLPGVGVISVCPEIERRGRVAARVAEAGVPLFLDKPLAGSVADAAAVRDAVRAAGVPAQMFSFASTPWARAAKRCVTEGRLGDLLAVHADVLFAKGPGGTLPEGTVRVEQEAPARYTFTEAKRELFDLGVYSVSLCLWLAGAAPSEVTAHTANYFFKEHAALDIEDFGAIAMRLRNGVVATATGGRIGWHSHPKLGPHRVTVVGTKGVETFDAWTPRVEVYADEPPLELPEPHPEDPMSMWRSTQAASGVPRKLGWIALEDEARWQRDEVSAFLDCLDTGHPPEVGIDLAYAATEVILAAYQTATRGETVTLG